VESGGHFDDLVAYGGWSMDDHFPAGFYHPERGTIFHPAPSPYGIPYRTLYSRNIANLFCAGRDHSASHVAMSSTRVMATCSTMGQAVGTAAAIAAREGANPRGVYQYHLKELRATLMDDDAWLPFSVRSVSPATSAATLSLSGDTTDVPESTPAGSSLETLRNGIDRPTEAGYNGWVGPLGTAIDLRWGEARVVGGLRLVFDSDLNRKDAAHGPDSRGTAKNMRHLYPLDVAPWKVPETLVRRVEVFADYGDGAWASVAAIENNYQRLVRFPLSLRGPVVGIRVVPTQTWGDTSARIHSVDIV
jgi:hypothetical protein